MEAWQCDHEWVESFAETKNIVDSRKKGRTNVGHYYGWIYEKEIILFENIFILNRFSLSFYKRVVYNLLVPIFYRLHFTIVWLLSQWRFDRVSNVAGLRELSSQSYYLHNFQFGLSQVIRTNSLWLYIM